MKGIIRTEISEEWAHSGVVEAGDYVFVSYCMANEGQSIENQINEGEWVVTIYSVTGTFMEEWFGMKPTGESITFRGVNVDRIKDGKIIEHGGAANLLEPLMKAGVIIKKE